MRALTHWPLILLLACNGGKSDSDGTDGDADTDADTDTDTDSDTDADLPDPHSLLDPNVCPDAQYAPQNVSTYYVIGEFTVVDDIVEGYEGQPFYFPENIQEECDYDEVCDYIWAISGEIGEPLGCPSCDYSIIISGQLDPSQTSCLEGLTAPFLVNEEPSWSATYDVKLIDDGTAAIYFHNTGTELGTGLWEGNKVIWHSASECAPYPDNLGDCGNE